MLDASLKGQLCVGTRQSGRSPCSDLRDSWAREIALVLFQNFDHDKFDDLRCVEPTGADENSLVLLIHILVFL